MSIGAPEVEFQVDELRVEVYPNRAALGAAAAADVARAIAHRLNEAPCVNMIFAAAPSQNEFLDALALDGSINWAKIHAFHMDEYLGITEDHPASFRRFLLERLFNRVGLAPDRLRLIRGERTDIPLAVCLDYEARMVGEPPDIVCAGIGENGHLAFNDPPVADFLDPVKIKVVRLDRACREQQVHDGCFTRIEDVPTHAFTLTVPALLAAPYVSLCVPGPRKAEAVRATLKDPIDESCPATALRRRPGAILRLDRDSASLVPPPR